MSSRRKKGQATFKSFQSTVAETTVQEEGTEALREEQIEAVKKFATPSISNPYQTLPATGLSRVLSKRLPEDMEGLVQYYNHIDTIQATSFIEKCRILAHANALFHGDETKAQFKEEQGNWTDFLNKIGQTRPQVSRYVSFWNVFGPKILEKAVQEEFSATKLAELLTWPEDPKLALLEERKYTTNDGELTVYEMTREQLREVKKSIYELKTHNLVNHIDNRVKLKSIKIDFFEENDALYESLQKYSKQEKISIDKIVRKALEEYLK